MFNYIIIYYYILYYRIEDLLMLRRMKKIRRRLVVNLRLQPYFKLADTPDCPVLQTVKI